MVEYHDMMNSKNYIFEIHGDERGSLVAIEEMRDIPFVIKRVYYMYSTACEAVRGCHAHKNLEQILICVHGSCKVRLDDGRDKEEFVLEKPYEGLYISNSIWREMYDFSEDAVLLVIASDYFNEEDYIRNYDEFLKFVQT